MKVKLIIKRLFYTLLIVFIGIQFFKPERNQLLDTKAHISSKYPVNSEIKNILKTSCNDCHSNFTVYPWYANIQPVAWWLNNHIVDGKKHLNFDNFLNYPAYRQFHTLEEIEEMIADDEMPLETYTFIHSEAKLNDKQKELLIHWTKALRDSMRAHYPSDSLINHKRRNK